MSEMGINAAAAVDAAIERRGGVPAVANGSLHNAADRGRETAPSEDAVALAFVVSHREYRFVSPWHRWIKWDGKRWREDSTGHVFERIRNLVRACVADGKTARSTMSAAFVSGVERLLRTDQRLVLLPEQLDADPWLLNTQDGLVDLRTGEKRPHDPTALCTRITNAGTDGTQGGELWAQFLRDVTLGDVDLSGYLQRVAGYAATGVTAEDVLVYLFGVGANGKSTFAEALAHALGDYALTFSPEVLMESRGERHPTELAQFSGVRLATTSEPASSAAWNDSRVKALTGDANISARFMRGDFFIFARTHKTLVIGNHMPRLAEVTHAIRRRVQMVPFRAIFQPQPGQDMRGRLKSDAGGAILAWVIEGARAWREAGTSPPAAVRDLTAEYLSDQDLLSQWLEERCNRCASFELLSNLHRDHKAWCERMGVPLVSNLALSRQLQAAGFRKRSTSVGKVFDGLELQSA